MRRTWPFLVSAALAMACGGDGSEIPPASQETAEAIAPVGNDPCALVSQEEMEALTGPLMEPPYRVDNRRQANPAGEDCLYRATDYRNVTLSVTWEDGPQMFRMLTSVGGAVEDLLGGRDQSADTLEVPWDQVGLVLGQLMALKGDRAIRVDALGSRLDLAGSAEIVDLAIARLDAPLRYDGAGAARNRKPIGRQAGDPCSLVTREEVEALMGALRAEPRPSEEGDACEFPMDFEFLGEPMVRALQVQWTDGFYALGQEREAMGVAAGAMAAHIDPDIPSLGENVAGGEPWDERITLMGRFVTVVKADVLLKIGGDGLEGFDEDKALQLLRQAVSRIQ